MNQLKEKKRKEKKRSEKSSKEGDNGVFKKGNDWCCLSERYPRTYKNERLSKEGKILCF